MVEARQLTLPNPSLSYALPPPHINSFLFDPNSLSLALRHSDTSFSLYPSFSPLSLSSFPPPSTLIPAPTSSAAFFHLHLLSSPNPFSIFLTTSPFQGGTSVLLRFFMFNPTRKAFSKLKVRSNHRDLKVDENRFGVVFAVSHGVSLKLEGGSNVFAMYSVSNSKIWVFAVKLVAEFEEVKLMKCAVIDCVLPVFSISVKFGHLILGEENGVRVFPLRPLVKGKTKNTRNVPFLTSVKLRTMKFRQDTKEWGECLVAFHSVKAENLEPSKKEGKLLKAISIQALSPSRLLVLDSTGVLHLLCFSTSVPGSESSYHMKQLTLTMKVCKFAVLPGAHTVWISDGQYTVHEIVLADDETSVIETDGKEVKRAIFIGEKIQDVVLVAADALFILGQGSIFAYATS